MNIPGTGIVNIGHIDLTSMDMETALMMVQTRRTQLLENSLRSQMEGVNASNRQMAEMNDRVSSLRQENIDIETANVSLASEVAELKDLQERLAASKHPDSEGWYGLSWGQGDDPALSHKTLEQVKQAGLKIPTGADAPRDIDRNGTMDAKGKVVQAWVNELDGKIKALENKLAGNKQTLETNKNTITDTRSKIDSLSNNQQMEMLRLQQLSNKHNESFDLMSSFMKKMQDNRSSIISNLR